MPECRVTQSTLIIIIFKKIARLHAFVSKSSSDDDIIDNKDAEFIARTLGWSRINTEPRAHLLSLVFQHLIGVWQK